MVDWGGKWLGLTATHKGTLGFMKMFCSLIGVWLHGFIHWPKPIRLHLKCLQFMICKLNLGKVE